MGVPHLALSDLNKKFKDLGYISTNKTYHNECINVAL